MGLIKDLFVKKHSSTTKIMTQNGLHLRPCAKIASLVKEYPFNINFIFNNKSVNAKNMNEILSLGLVYGDEITITAKGNHAKDAIMQITNMLDELSVHDIKSDDNVENLVCETVSYDGELFMADIICKGISFANIYHHNKLKYDNEKLTFNESIVFLHKELDSLSSDEENSEREIFLAQKEILDTLDCSNLQEFKKSIYSAISNLKETSNQSKIFDYQDIENRVINKMNGISIDDYPKSDFILVSSELFPSDMKNLSLSGVKGVIVQSLAPRSHVALLLRGYNIPAMAIKDISILKNMNNPIILDANSGIIVINPSSNDINNTNNRINEIKIKLEKDNDDRLKTAITKSGKKIKILANISDYDSAIQAKESGCEGIGLFRTEFLFQATKPTLDEQINEYSKIFELFDEVTVRTLDVGGDKKLPYLIIADENNPFLGIRGVRLFNTHLDVMKEQLLAIFLSKRKGEIKIMFPMVATVDEFIYAKSIALEIAKNNNICLDGISFGIMVEVPSVLFLIDGFDKVVDFYSIGTNDLTQYLFAIDRTHKTLKIDPYSSVIFDAIRLLREKSIKPISICGELASDIDATKILVDMGIETLSVTSTMIPAIKARTRDV